MEEKRTITGIYSPARSWDFGFVDVEWDDKGYYVHWFNKNNALPWDKVLARLKTFRWKDEAVVEKVLERSDKIFIWNFQEWKKNANWKWFSFWFVIIRDENFKTDVFIPWKYIKTSKEWDLVWIKIISWENKKSPKWEIVEVLWNENQKDLSVESYILESGFKQTFNHSIKKDLEKFSWKLDIKNSLTNWRKDLRDLFTFTIDGEDAKDLDDAISIEKIPPLNLPLSGETSKNSPPVREGLGEGFKLYVHIADVANYIKENTELDKTALKRATSVYLTDRVIPMLPEKLSNNLCSLNPDTPKLTITCEMLVWKDWVIRNTKVYESIIESNFRLTYKEVDKIENSFSPDKEDILKNWDKLFWGQKLNSDLISKIKESLELKSIVEKNRQNTWVLDFDFPETKVVLDENKKVLEIKQYPRYRSNKLIELFMVSANESVWKLFSNIPFLHRIHPKPSLEDISKLQNTLNLFNIPFVLKKFDTKEFSELLKIIEKDKSRSVLEKIVLRTLSKAVYSDENEWHFWLWLNFYSHFTSPIRRYPDLQIHRIIKESLHKKLDNTRIKHYEQILKNVAEQCSTQERKAENLEYKVRDYYTCTYYENKVWETFEVNISWLIPKWFFVMLKDTSEWFVLINPPLTSKSSKNPALTPPLTGMEDKKNFKEPPSNSPLNRDGGQGNFEYNEELMQFEDKKNKKTYKLWDELKVELIEVDLKELRLNFSII